MGHCYRFALEMFFNLYASQSSETPAIGADHFASEAPGHPQDAWVRNLNLPELGDHPVLVHGFPIGQGGVVDGKKICHAWLEGNRHVVDCGTHERTLCLISREQYYRLGRIDHHECHRYTIEQAAEHILDTGKDGLWSKPPADALIG
jgi:hypothetical protein